MLTTYKTTLSEKKQLTSDVYYLKFNLDEPKELNFIPGQYMIMMVPSESEGEPVRRLYSIASPVSQKDSFDLLIKIIPGGIASTYVQNLKVGERVVFQGPAGVFRLQNTPKNKVFMVTGCGLVPIRSILLSTLDARSSKLDLKAGRSRLENPSSNLQPQDLASSFQHPSSNSLYLFWGLPHFSDVYFLDELKKLAEEKPKFHFLICLSREQNLEMIKEEDKKYFILGHVNDGFEQEIRNLKPARPAGGLEIKNLEYYLCGNRNVTDSLKEYLVGKQIPQEQVFFEKF